MTVAQGYCTNHGEPVAKINGPDGNICLLCEGKKQGEGNTDPNAVDPGEEKMRMMLAAAGVPVGIRKEAGTTVTGQKTVIVPQAIVQPSMSFEKCIEQARKIMESVPMPKDVKQFKAVNKIIADLKKLSGETNA